MFRGLNLSSFCYSSRCLGQWDQPGKRHPSLPPQPSPASPYKPYRCKAAGGKPSTLSPFLGLGGEPMFPWPQNKARQSDHPWVEQKSTLALRLQK